MAAALLRQMLLETMLASRNVITRFRSDQRPLGPFLYWSSRDAPVLFAGMAHSACANFD